MTEAHRDRHVHYGCGPFCPPTWRNFDASPTLRLQRIPLLGRFFAGGSLPVFPATAEYGDILEGLPVAKNSCRAVYCSHVLEHLALDDLRRALVNTFDILESGGIFRCVLPDLERLAREYLASDDAEAATAFIKRSGLGRTSRPRRPMALLRSWLGNSAHLWMWDFASLRSELERCGFVEVRRAEYGDSAYAPFADVEDEDRWQGCLGVECRKPVSATRSAAPAPPDP